jgi:NitT/TauT family transport system substrate-binding protein
MFLARSMGWLDESKVTLIEAGSFTDSIKMLEEGSVQAAGVTLDEVLRIRERGIPISVILVCDVSVGADMVLAKPGVKTLAEIKGKKIGVEDGALGALMLYETLRAAQLNREDVTLVSVAVEKQAEAWQRGEIDVAISFEPGSSQLMKLGASVIFDSRQIPELIFDVIAVRTADANDEHEQALRHLVAAHLRALHHLNTNPADAAYRMAPHFNLPVDQVMPSFKGLVLPDLNNNIRLMAAAKPSMLKSAAQVAEVMRKAGILHQPENLQGLLRPEYLPRELS